MKKILFGLLFFIGTLGSHAFADLAGYTIKNYDVAMEIQQDGSMQVIETIDVYFSEYRHGIYRDIRLQDGETYRTINNPRSNEHINTKTKTTDTLSLQLGSANTEIIGDKQYQIGYTVKNAIKVFDNQAELYRNIVGAERNTTIDHVSWTIHIPEQISPHQNLNAYWGDSNSQNTTNITFQNISPTTRGGNLNTQLQAKQGVTIALQFPQDYFLFPDNYDKYFQKNKFGRGFLSNIDREKIIINLVVIIILGGVIGTGLVRYLSQRGRRATKPIVTNYNPPQGIEPVVAFYLRLKKSTNPKLFSALLYFWATSGYITIEKTTTKSGLFGLGGAKEDYILRQTNKIPANSFDEKLMRTLFSKRSLGDYFKFLNPQSSTDIQTPGTSDQESSLSLNALTYSDITNILTSISHAFKSHSYLVAKPGWSGKIGVTQLSTTGQAYYDHLAGYKEYLSKVERPVIESELKNDPNYINTILPWAVIFGVETQLFNVIEDLIQNLERYKSDDGTLLNIATLSHMTKRFQTSATPPRSSGSSGISSGHVSGGGGGGGGGSR